MPRILESPRPKVQGFIPSRKSTIPFILRAKARGFLRGIKERVLFFTRVWLPFLAYAGVICFGSSLSVSVSLPFPYFDKVVHFCEYIVFGILAARAFTQSVHQITDFKLLLLITVISFSYGFLDEMHQSFVPFRHVEIGDIFFDTLGGLAGTLVYR